MTNPATTNQPSGTPTSTNKFILKAFLLGIAILLYLALLLLLLLPHLFKNSGLDSEYGYSTCLFGSDSIGCKGCKEEGLINASCNTCESLYEKYYINGESLSPDDIRTMRSLCEHVPEIIEPTVQLTADSYVGWQTFESANLGISFKYPASFNVQESESAIQIYTEGNSGSRPLQITIHTEPFDKEFFASHNLRQEKHDRTIQIGNESFTTSYFSSAEGSPGSNPDEIWFSKWEDEIVEIGERTVIISTHVESIDNKNQEMATIINVPSLEDFDDAVLILKSMVLN